MTRIDRRALVIAVALSVAAPGAAHAFCGFYVSGAGADLFNNATQVVLMRHGTRTVLSMQNNYQGPPKDFAMVVPVPVVLQEENVKTLDRAIFQRVDQLAAPRLVEYWEQDPCRPEMPKRMRFSSRGKDGAMPVPSNKPADLGVTIEAQFTVGEYEIVILSAKDSTGLDTWLRAQKYQIPEGAEPLLRPYVEGGSKFFVAKVDPEKVAFNDGMATLSPLRFHYDSDEFSLPVRLGLINSAGTQDLIVHILAPGQRYEVANYDNVTIPTNLDVADDTRNRFGEFYAALLDATLENDPGAVVTEYAWDAASCDPCPTPALNPGELATLGLDVLHTPPTASPKDNKSAGQKSADSQKTGKKSKAEKILDELKATRGAGMRRPPPPPRPPVGGFVLTRLHARYGKSAIGEDLVFRAAPPVVGGREIRGSEGALERGSTPGGYNTFQARYAIRHKWTGEASCENPRWGVWGGPPGGTERPEPKPATDLAFAQRGKVTLGSFVPGGVPELGVAKRAAEAPSPSPSPTSDGKPDPKTTPPATGGTKTSKGCAVGPGPFGSPWPFALGALALLVAVRRRPGGVEGR